jgi:nucleotide-binding universal stress UspA family protein
MKILVVYDGSKEGKEALKLARERAKACDARIKVILNASCPVVAIK